MKISEIVQRVNDKLAGELLTFDALKIHLDSVIDDINSKLCSCYPTFSEFTSANYPERYPDYNFFPEKYIRGVVIPGAAYKFFVTDEEGIFTAQQYKFDYSDAIFVMERDFMELVPEEFQTNETGSIVMNNTGMSKPFHFDGW
jgi:hypothetical protein